MVLRAASPDDAAAVADLATQLGYPTQPEQAAARLRDLAGRPDHAVLVAAEGGAVIGWIHVCGERRVETDPFAEIAGLVVDAARRSRGAGAALVEAAADWARAEGYATLRVRSNTVRTRTHAFYERAGFTRAKTQVVLARDLQG
jgi:GNAT superfamily N-acetyltransferase